MMNVIKSLKNLAIGLVFVVAISGCATTYLFSEVKSHKLVGAWKAADNTIFIFRENGSFHGVDWQAREIWGNWVELSPTRIGFQSLTHDNFYRPQYAVISTDENRMSYIITGGVRFITAERVDRKEAAAEIDRMLIGKIVLPSEEKDIRSATEEAP